MLRYHRFYRYYPKRSPCWIVIHYGKGKKVSQSTGVYRKGRNKGRFPATKLKFILEVATEEVFSNHLKQETRIYSGSHVTIKGIPLKAAVSTLFIGVRQKQSVWRSNDYLGIEESINLFNHTLGPVVLQMPLYDRYTYTFHLEMYEAEHLLI